MTDEGGSLPAGALIGRVVRHRGVVLGQVSDVLLDPSLERAVGLEVETAGGNRLFLPWSTGDDDGGAIEVPIPLSLLSDRELGFYLKAGLRLSDVVEKAENGEMLLDRRGRVRPRREGEVASS